MVRCGEVMGLGTKTMSLPIGEQLQRLSAKLRAEIGPAVTDEYTRTQTFMASVILERLSKQVMLASDHLMVEQQEVAMLHEQLAGILVDVPDVVAHARVAAEATLEVAALGTLIRELYAWGSGEKLVEDALSLIRPVLRADIDRRMEIAQ
jgi:hypothetical protein